MSPNKKNETHIPQTNKEQWVLDVGSAGDQKWQHLTQQAGKSFRFITNASTQTTL